MCYYKAGGEYEMKTKDELPVCPVATAVSLIGGKWKLMIMISGSVRYKLNIEM